VRSLLWLLPLVLGLSAWITARVRSYALKVSWLDQPGHRSSHVQPTPRGGGIGIVISSMAAVVVAWLAYDFDGALARAILVGGLAVAVIGFLDDRRPLPARARVIVHALAAVYAMYCLGGLPPMQFGDRLYEPGIVGYVIGTLGIVWTLNLFNFMDGIDGIAASEVVFVCAAGVVLALVSGASTTVPVAALILAAASFGFLIWNWPPARIFMGDAGSGYTGYVVAVLAIAAARESPVALLTWVMLAGVFVIDATVTLVRRVARRERASEAHRSHAYQWLARRWSSHRRVTIAVILVDVLWLFPCALCATLFPVFAGWILCVALASLIAAALAAGAGRREISTDDAAAATTDRSRS
jgi:Fuc2NAc and GlcNAc transferase